MSRHRRRDVAPQAGAPRRRLRTVHIRDLVLDERAGARVGSASQRIRVNVALTVADDEDRPPADDLADVVCYGAIAESIREIVARGRGSRTEDLADQIAGMALVDARVLRARVAVDRLDAHRDAAAIGVEIVRSRDLAAVPGPHSRRTAVARSAGPWVVKLGGSLSRTRRLAAWLQALASCGLPVAVVPGGGSFADEVRASQERWRFDDATAHRMALLAMDQMGCMMAALVPGLRPCAGHDEFRTAFAAGETAVWLPSAMALGQDDIAESWDVTSDSLAAWLAGWLGARGLVLVKSAEPPAGEADASVLAAAGLVDRRLAHHLAAGAVDAWCVGPDDAAGAVAAMAVGHPPGCRVVAGRRTRAGT